MAAAGKIGEEVQRRRLHSGRILHDVGKLDRDLLSRVGANELQVLEVDNRVKLYGIGEQRSRPPVERVLQIVVKPE